MGQKANPIALRLKTTNKNFASSWYSDTHYFTLLNQELKVRAYLKELLSQIQYSSPITSLSFTPKRVQVLMLYLNPAKIRQNRNERFQLGPYNPLPRLKRSIDHSKMRSSSSQLSGPYQQNLSPLTWILLGRRELLSTLSTSLDKKKNVTFPLLMRHNLKGVAPTLLYALLSSDAHNEVMNGEKFDIWCRGLEMKFMVYYTMVSLAHQKLKASQLLFQKDFELFYKIDRFFWFQGRGKGCFSGIDYQWGMTNSTPGGNLYQKNKKKLVARRSLFTPVPENSDASDTQPVMIYEKELSRRGPQLRLACIERALSRSLKASTALYPYKSVQEEQTAKFLSGEIAFYLERRIPFRRIKQVLSKDLQKDYIEGVRVKCSGRSGGRSKKAQRAKKDGFQWGQTSSHVFSSKLSFDSRSALTPLGKIGIKVWVCFKSIEKES